MAKNAWVVLERMGGNGQSPYTLMVEITINYVEGATLSSLYAISRIELGAYLVVINIYWIKKAYV